MMGEAQKLSDEESAAFTRHYLRQVNGRVPVIVGVSNPGTANLIKLSQLAMDAGACGVMIAPLTGLKTENQIVAYFNEVISALGEKIPVVFRITRRRPKPIFPCRAFCRSWTPSPAS
jgi:4-hydroxy-tetrahydrodipicolinate synthase